MLTKSLYLTGLTCHKLMWITKNKPDLIPEDDASTFRMEQGLEIGKLSHELYPNGVSVEDRDKIKCMELTKSNLGKTLFEAGFIYNDIYCRVDILTDKFDLIEVKSSTHVKEEHLEDVAFQKFVLEKCGITVNRCFVLHLNNEYVKDGKIDVTKLFKYSDVTLKLPKIDEEIINKMKKTIASDNIPKSEVSHLCNSCPLWGQCHAFLPSDHVLLLYRDMKKHGYKLLGEGIHLLKDIPDEYELSSHQLIQKKCAKTGEVHIDKEKLKLFLKEITEPISFLDFETFQMALPPYDGTFPFQQIPFQYSLHVSATADSPLLANSISSKSQMVKEQNSCENKSKCRQERTEHFEFLYDGKKDPREEFILSLEKNLPSSGTIIAYFMTFEKGRIEELAEAFPKHAKFLKSLLPRFVDLLVPFRNFWYYSPKQEGSCSIKSVLPALCGKSYSTMEIKGGSQAASLFTKLMFEEVQKDEREKIRKALLDYCELDTKAMIDVLDVLKKSVK